MVSVSEKKKIEKEWKKEAIARDSQWLNECYSCLTKISNSASNERGVFFPMNKRIAT